MIEKVPLTSCQRDGTHKFPYTPDLPPLIVPLVKLESTARIKSYIKRNLVDWDLYIFFEKSSNIVSSPQGNRTRLAPKSKLFLLKRLGIVNLTFEGKSLEYYCPLHQSKTNRCDQFVTILYQNRYKYIKIDTTRYK